MVRSVTAAEKHQHQTNWYKGWKFLQGTYSQIEQQVMMMYINDTDENKERILKDELYKLIKNNVALINSMKLAYEALDLKDEYENNPLVYDHRLLNARERPAQQPRQDFRFTISGGAG